MESLPKELVKIITTYKESLEEVDDYLDILEESNLSWFPSAWDEYEGTVDDTWYIVQTHIETEMDLDELKEIVGEYGLHKIITMIFRDFDGDVITNCDSEESLFRILTQYIFVETIFELYDDLIDCEIIINW